MKNEKVHIFDSQGADYEEAFKLFLAHTNQKVEAKKWLEDYVKQLPAAQRFVDVGAGTGVVTAWLQGRFEQTTAIEPNLELVKDLQAACPRAHILSTPIGKTLLPADNDFVLLSHVLYYLPPYDRVDTIERLASWLSPTGTLVVILQNNRTECMNLLDKFTHTRFDLNPIASEFTKRTAGKFTTRFELVPSIIETKDAATMSKIAEFILNLVPDKPPITRDEVATYIEKHAKKGNAYRLSCDQDFLVIRRQVSVSFQA